MAALDPLSKVLEDARYDDLRGLWWVAGRPVEYGFSENYAESYSSRIDLFCTVMEWLLSRGQMRLAKGGSFLEGNSNQQVNLFREAFPEQESDFDYTIWFFLDECPGGAVWYTDIDDNGFQTTPVGDGRFYFWT